jgi:hypothetical protein
MVLRGKEGLAGRCLRNRRHPQRGIHVEPFDQVLFAAEAFDETIVFEPIVAMIVIVGRFGDVGEHVGRAEGAQNAQCENRKHGMRIPETLCLTNLNHWIWVKSGSACGWNVAGYGQFAAVGARARATVVRIVRLGFAPGPFRKLQSVADRRISVIY